MCFSAEASFGASAASPPAGIYGVSRAAEEIWRFLLLGIYPCLYAQQAAEGFVWLGLNHDHPAVVQWSAGDFPVLRPGLLAVLDSLERGCRPRIAGPRDGCSRCR